MTTIRIPRRSIDNVYAGFTHRKMVDALIADADARWPHLGIYMATTSWVDDADADAVVFIGSNGTATAEFIGDAELEATLTEVKRAVRVWAAERADAHQAWLETMDVAVMTRPKRAERVADTCGRVSSRRGVAGYDWLEQLSSKDARRIGRRFVDSDLYPPDVLAEFIRSALSADWTDSECMAWLLEQWTLCDALRSVAAGKVPRYASNLGDLLDPDLSAQGFTVDGLFDYRAIDHVAEVLLGASIDDADYAELPEAAMPLESAYVAAF